MTSSEEEESGSEDDSEQLPAGVQAGNSEKVPAGVRKDQPVAVVPEVRKDVQDLTTKKSKKAPLTVPDEDQPEPKKRKKRILLEEEDGEEEPATHDEGEDSDFVIQDKAKKPAQPAKGPRTKVPKKTSPHPLISTGISSTATDEEVAKAKRAHDGASKTREEAIVPTARKGLGRAAKEAGVAVCHIIPLNKYV